VVVHCDLGPRVEWDGTRELAEEQARHYGLRFEVVSRPQGDILDEVRQRHETIKRKAAERAASRLASGVAVADEPLLHAPPQDDQVSKVLTATRRGGQAGVAVAVLRRPVVHLGPEARAGRPGDDALADETAEGEGRSVARVKKAKRKRGEPKAKRVLVPAPVRILNCMGMRAAESPARSKLRSFKLDRVQTSGQRAVHTYLPIFDWSAEQVWADIKDERRPTPPRLRPGHGPALVAASASTPRKPPSCSRGSTTGRSSTST
jgi:hypothetical protein